MSKTIDTRVVEMQFDNSKFNKNIKSSQDALDDFDKSINRSSFSDGLGSIGSAVVALNKPFSALEEIAIGALRRIGSEAMAAGEKVLKSLTTDQIKEGFTKYSELTSNTATLMAQGFENGEVESMLDKLLWYTDETSYNFSDMTSNISKFTAAGQGLEDSYTAMVGIANWAALSGQNAGTASRAMYQLSQAMGAGQLRRQDYMSIQNANMDTQAFRKTLIAAAEAEGTLARVSEDTWEIVGQGTKVTTETMVETLTEGGWATSDVMMAAFASFADGVEEIYEYTEENGVTATEAIQDLGGELSDFGLTAFRAAQEARTFEDMLGAIRDAVSTGWMSVFTEIFGDAEESIEVWTYWANNLYDLFMMPTDALNEILSIWNEFGGSAQLFDNVKTIWESFMEIVYAIQDAFTDVFGTSRFLGAELFKITSPLKNIAKAISDFVQNEEKMDKLKSGFKGIANVFKALGKIVNSTVLQPVKALLGSLFGGEGLLDGFATFGDFLTKITTSQKFLTFIDFVQKALVGISKAVGGFVSGFVGGFSRTSGEVGGIKGFLMGIAEGAKEGIQAIIQAFGDATGIDVSAAIEKIGGIFDWIKDKFSKIDFEAIGEKIGKIFDWIKDKFSKIDFKAIGETIKNFGEKIKDFFSNLKDSDGVQGIIDKIKSFFDKSKDTQKLANQSDEDPNKKPPIMVFLEKIGEWFKGLGGMIQDGSLERVLKVVASIVAIILQIILALKVVGLLDKSSKAVDKFSSIEESIKGAFEGLKGMFDDIGQAAKDKAKAEMFKSLAIMIGALGAAIAVLALLNPNKVLIATLALGGMVVLMALVAKMLDNMDSDSKDLGKKAMAYNVIAGVLGNIAMALVLMSTKITPPEGIINATLALSFVMGVLTGVMYALSKMDVSMKGILGIVMLSVALNAIIPVFLALSTLNLGQVLVGLIAIAGALTILVVAAYAAQAVGPQLMLVAGALALLGLAIGLAAAGIGALLAGLAALFTIILSLSSMSATAVATMGLIITTLIRSFAQAIPVIARSIGEGIVEFANAIGNGSAAIINAVTTVLVAIFTAIVEILPLLLEIIGTLIAGILEIILVNIPAILEILGTLLAGVIALLYEFLPQIIDLVGNLITWLLDFLYEVVPQLLEFLMFLSEQLFAFLLELTPKILDFVYDLIVELLDFLMEKVPDFVERGVELALALLQGISDSAVELIEGTNEIVTDLIFGIIESIGLLSVDIAEAAVDTVITVLNSISDSLEEKTPELSSAIERIITTVMEAGKEVLNGFLEPFTEVGGNLIQGVIDGISSGLSAIGEAAANVASSALDAAKEILGIHSPSKEFGKIGMYSDQGLADGLAKYSNLVEEASNDVGRASLSSLRDAMNNIGDEIIDDDINPVITPIIDYSEIQNGIGSINDLFGTRDISLRANGAYSSKENTSENLLRSIANGVTGNQSANTFNITINAAEGQDVNELANVVADRINNELIRRKAVFA